MTQTAKHQATGATGEECVATYLAHQGWQVVARNWRCNSGELDIIAWDPDGVLVFCEVKARRGTGYGQPLEAITYAKISKLRSLVAEFLRGLDAPVRQIRLDAVGVLLFPDGTYQVDHVRGIG